jgi:hypothetical protein
MGLPKITVKGIPDDYNGETLVIHDEQAGVHFYRMKIEPDEVTEDGKDRP